MTSISILKKTMTKICYWSLLPLRWVFRMLLRNRWNLGIMKWPLIYIFSQKLWYLKFVMKSTSSLYYPFYHLTVFLCSFLFCLSFFFCFTRIVVNQTTNHAVGKKDSACQGDKSGCRLWSRTGRDACHEGRDSPHASPSLTTDEAARTDDSRHGESCV